MTPSWAVRPLFELERAPTIESNSSKKRIAGAASRARLNREEIIFSESPTNGEKSSADEMLWKDAAHDVAAARTSSDLPQPGGPYNKTPLGPGIPKRWKASGCFNGHSILLLMHFFASSNPPTSSHLTFRNSPFPCA